MYDFEHSENVWKQFLIETKNKNVTLKTERDVVTFCFNHSLATEIYIFQQRVELRLGTKKENGLNLVLYLTRLQQFLLWTASSDSNFTETCNKIICKILSGNLSPDELNFILKKTSSLQDS